MRSVRGAALALMFACGATLCAQSPSEATELSVRLYSTQTVHTLHIVPVRAVERLCVQCKALPASIPIDVTWASGRLLVAGKPMEAFLLEGQARFTADGGKVETGAGRWSVRAAPDGLHVVLVIPSERYLMAVLAGEASPQEPAESLKALAILARSFALVNPNRHGAEGLCDSTHCQAMRLAPVPDTIEQAVRATAGETLWFGPKRVAGYFTQNCGGETADASEVWGGPRQAWLTAHPDPYCRRDPAAWHASIEKQQLREALQAQGLRDIASIDSVRILSRDSSGRAAQVELAGGGQKPTLRASDLRFAVDRALGWNQIRSDAYNVHIEGTHVIFDGKGHGHGVGLCQAGAAEMAREGKSVGEILGFYFPGTHVRIAPDDNGWKATEAHGWTLRSHINDVALLQTGDAVWARARSLWPGAALHPGVTLTPDTELFRQMTNEPGWALASTRGASITLQPLVVISRHGKVEDLLLHEFLHSLVESEASPNAPLWLREGLVESLAGEPGSGTAMPRAQMEAMLAHPQTLEEAQRAHHAACASVKALIAKYGLSAVRGWLRSGLPANVAAGQ